jgi:hypothetical protein
MPGDEGYRKQVALLVKILPLIAVETVFALKGGNGHQPVPAQHAPAFRGYRSDICSRQGSRILAQGDRCCDPPGSRKKSNAGFLALV